MFLKKLIFVLALTFTFSTLATGFIKTTECQNLEKTVLYKNVKASIGYEEFQQSTWIINDLEYLELSTILSESNEMSSEISSLPGAVSYFGPLTELTLDQIFSFTGVPRTSKSLHTVSVSVTDLLGNELFSGIVSCKTAEKP